MGDLKKLYAVDETKETEGTWQDIGDGISVLVARIGNPKYQKLLNNFLKPHRRAVRRGTIADEILENIITKTMASTILLGWKGLEEDGQEILYSQTESLRVLTDYKDFRDIVSELANEIEAFRVEEDEEAAKN